MSRRTHIPLLVVVALLVGAPATASAAPVMIVGDDGTRIVDDPALPPVSFRQTFPAPAPRVRAETAQDKKKGPTVGDAIKKALAKGTITAEAAKRYQRIFNDAKSTRNGLGGARRAALANVVGTVEGIARRRDLTGGRMAAVFLNLQRNTEFWPKRAIPSPGTRIRFKNSEVVFEPYSGQGIQIQPFITGVAANQLWEACNGGVRLNPELKCDQKRLRTVLDELVTIAAQRGSFLAWEYYFFFGGGTPPWISGLSQGSIVQALARGGTYLQDPRYLATADRALGSFEVRNPTGLRYPAFGGDYYTEYSFDAGQQIFNGQVRAVVGLFDYAQITGSARAQGLYVKGERAARAMTPKSDTGAWSLYEMGGPESDLTYHRLLRDFLRDLCERNKVEVYCTTATRFTTYLEQHPRIKLLAVGGARVGRTVPITFELSKLSNVRLRVSRGDTTVFVANRRVGYGKRVFNWVPRRAGRHSIKLEATDLLNHHEITRGSVTVRK